MILVAHVFGCRMDLTEVVNFAAKHDLFVVEDCAQVFLADGYLGHPSATVSMFSFGAIKTATALGGAIFTIGPVKAGIQATVEFLGNEQVASDVFGYRNVAWGVSFNVSDNLSVSYGEMESKKGFQSLEGGATEVMLVDSIQAAYTMGGATIKIAESSVDNGTYTAGSSADKDATTVALSLAF